MIPAAVGALLLFGALGAMMFGPPVRLGDVFSSVLLPVTATMGMLTQFLHGSYRRTFGDVVSTWQQKLLAVLPAMLVVLGILVDMTLDFQGARSGPSFAPVAVAAYSITVMIRDWPWRPHQLIAASAGVAGAIVTAAVPAAATERWGPDPARAAAYLL